MQPNEYQKLALLTEKTPRIFVVDPDDADAVREVLNARARSNYTHGTNTPIREVNARLLHGLLGGASEQGEAIDPFKKELIYGKPMDRVNVIEEEGDKLWYIALTLDSVGATMQEAMERNIAKLKVRFGDKFREDAAINRDLPAERAALEDDGPESTPILDALVADPNNLGPTVEQLREKVSRQSRLIADLEARLFDAELLIGKKDQALSDISEFVAGIAKGKAREVAARHLRHPEEAPMSPDHGRARNDEYNQKPYTGPVDFDKHPQDRGRDEGELAGTVTWNNNGASE